MEVGEPHLYEARGPSILKLSLGTDQAMGIVQLHICDQGANFYSLEYLEAIHNLKSIMLQMKVKNKMWLVISIS